MASDDVSLAFRREWPQAVSSLIGTFGDIDLAEDALADAYADAVRRWPHDPPAEPTDWIVATAHHRAIARIRRDAAHDATYGSLLPLARQVENRPATQDRPDERLGLIFTCCHPALPEAARVALTLRLLSGLSTARIATAFGVSESTMTQRLDRAKARIRDHHLPYLLPQQQDWNSRVTCVLAVVHLIFAEGSLAPRPATPSQDDLASEAIRLGRILVDLVPDDPEVRGSLALMLFVDARRDARTGSDGSLVPLGAQDRTLWHHDDIEEGRFLLRRSLRQDHAGPYQIQACLEAVHCAAESTEATDWPQIMALYDRLMLLAPTDSVALNRAIAVAEIEGPQAALASVERLGLDTHLFHAVRADLLTRLGRTEEAERAWTAAVARVRNQTEQAHLRDQVAR